MVQKFKVDASDLGRVADIVENTSNQIDRAVTPAVNKAGHSMLGRIVHAAGEFISETVRKAFEHLPQFKDKYFGPETEVIKSVYEILVPKPGVAKEDSEYEIQVRPPIYYRWLTREDEGVCEICGPRHGIILPENQMREIWPAHDNCRCKIEPIDLTPGIMGSAEKELGQAGVEATDGVLRTFTEYFRD